MATASGLCNGRAVVGALLLFLFLLGCAADGAQPRSVSVTRESFSPRPGQALVVFMRPSLRGSGEVPAIYDITSGEPVAVGIARSRTKLPHHAAPGKRRYMVVEETASFMDAELDAGKTYYVVVDTRSSIAKVDFLLRPVHRGKWTTPEFARWDAATKWVANRAASDDSPKYNMSNARRLQAEYLEEWLYRPGKATLFRRDGR